MGKNDEKNKTNQMINAQVQRSTQQTNDFATKNNARMSQAQQQSNDMYDVLFGGYKKFAEGGNNFTPAAGTSSGGGGGGGSSWTPQSDSRWADTESSYRDFMRSGGIDADRMREGYGTFRDFMGKNGGWDATRLAGVESDIAGYRDIARTGGVSDEGINRIRGGGVFDEFARNGGYSDADISNIRRRGNSTIPAFYAAARDEAGRQAAVQGGYGPGQSALMSRLSRNAAQQGADAALNTELGIRENVNKGRQWGASSMSGAEGNLASLQSSNRLAALGGASSTATALQESINKGRQWGTEGLTNTERSIQEMTQKGKLAGTQGLEGMVAADRAEAARQAAAAEAAASRASAEDRWAAQFNREGLLAGLGGMSDLYRSSPGNLDAASGFALQNIGLGSEGVYGGTGQRIQNNQRRNWMDYMGGVGNMLSGVGALAAF